jgi:hypothetical protein
MAVSTVDRGLCAEGVECADAAADAAAAAAAAAAEEVHSRRCLQLLVPKIDQCQSLQ